MADPRSNLGSDLGSDLETDLKSDLASDLAMRLKDLEALVRELTCEKPNLETLKAHMIRLGVEFCDNPAERMSRVLLLLQHFQFDFGGDLPDFSTTKLNTRSKKVRKDGIEI